MEHQGLCVSSWTCSVHRGCSHINHWSLHCGFMGKFDSPNCSNCRWFWWSLRSSSHYSRILKGRSNWKSRRNGGFNGNVNSKHWVIFHCHAWFSKGIASNDQNLGRLWTHPDRGFLFSDQSTFCYSKSLRRKCSISRKFTCQKCRFSAQTHCQRVQRVRDLQRLLGISHSSLMDVSANGGTPSHHPFLDGIFRYTPSSYWGTPILGNHHICFRSLQVLTANGSSVPSLARLEVLCPCIDECCVATRWGVGRSLTDMMKNWRFIIKNQSQNGSFLIWESWICKDLMSGVTRSNLGIASQPPNGSERCLKISHEVACFGANKLTNRTSSMIGYYSIFSRQKLGLSGQSCQIRKEYPSLALSNGSGTANGKLVARMMKCHWSVKQI